MGAELFHADRRTEIMKLIVVFRNFRTRLKKGDALLSTLAFSVFRVFKKHLSEVQKVKPYQQIICNTEFLFST